MLGKKQSPRHGGEMILKKTEFKSSWTLFFFRPFLPHVWDSVFFRAPKLASALDNPSSVFQHQGSGYSFRGAKGSLYWFCRILILSKCWGWSNLLYTYIPTYPHSNFPTLLHFHSYIPIFIHSIPTLLHSYNSIFLPQCGEFFKRAHF